MRRSPPPLSGLFALALLSGCLVDVDAAPPTTGTGAVVGGSAGMAK